MKSLFYILISLFILTSCRVSRVPFTNQLKQEVSDTLLYKVQYYVSSDVTLYKVNSKQHSVDVKSGVIYIKDKSSVEKIFIKKGTPCVLTKQVSDTVARFSFDNSGNTLKFAQSHDGVYTLAGEWSDDGQVGKIKYGNETYLTSDGYVYIKCIVVRKDIVTPNYKVLPGQIVSK